MVPQGYIRYQPLRNIEDHHQYEFFFIRQSRRHSIAPIQMSLTSKAQGVVGDMANNAVGNLESCQTDSASTWIHGRIPAFGERQQRHTSPTVKERRMPFLFLPVLARKMTSMDRPRATPSRRKEYTICMMASSHL